MTGRNGVLTIIALLLSTAAGAQVAPSQLAESNASPAIVTVADGGADVNQTWGRPRVLQSFDGLRVLMYAQGLPNLNANPLLDQIWLFRNENDAGGWSSVYNSEAKVRILPTPNPSPTLPANTPGLATTHNYPHHWPYKLHGRYYMVVQDIDGAPTADNFRFFLLGYSNDGVNWTWRRFLRVRVGMSLDQIAWKDMIIEGTRYNYGFVSGTKDGGGIGTTAIRFKQDATTGGAWAFDATSNNTLAIWSGGAWASVPTCASIGDNSGYDFCLYKDAACATSDVNCPLSARIDPDWVIPAMRHPSLHRLSKHNNAYELWNHATVADEGCGCEDGAATENNNTFAYRRFTPPTTLAQNPATTLDSTVRYVRQDVPRARCMPASYRQARITPFRLEWTADLLYSRTGDAKGSNPDLCSTTGWGYIVRTRLESSAP
jgi:hypothetical protein